MRTIVLVAAAMAALPLLSSEARADGPWCIYDVGGRTNCGFYSYAQCMTNLSGIGGTCQPNPNFQASGNNSNNSNNRGKRQTGY